MATMASAAITFGSVSIPKSAARRIRILTDDVAAARDWLAKLRPRLQENRR